MCRAQLKDKRLGVFGELHPQVQRNYDLSSAVIGGEIDLDMLVAGINVDRFPIEPVREFPPILEDIAVVVDEAIPAEKVEGLIRQTGGQVGGRCEVVRYLPQHAGWRGKEIAGLQPDLSIG